MPLKKHEIKLIGRREFVNFPLFNICGMEAKIDTGAYTSAIHCENITVNYENSKPILYFTVQHTEAVTLRFENFSTKKIRNSFGIMEERYVIKTIISIGRKRIWSTVSLSNRDAMRYPVLIGRRILKGKFLIDANRLHTGGIKLSKAFKRLRPKKNNLL